MAKGIKRETAIEFRTAKRSTKILVYLTLIIASIVVLLPLFWLISSSLKTQQELTFNIWGLPKSPQIINYYKAWTASGINIYMRNSFIVMAASIIISVVASTMLAYVVSRMKFKYNSLLYYIVIVGMMVPIHSYVIPLYIDTLNWGMHNNRLFLGLIYAASRIPISMFILDGFMKTIPKELEECATIDGCGVSRTFLQIILPLCTDGLVTVTILTAMSSWNELLLSMLILTNPELKTLPIGLLGFVTEYNTEYTQLCAALVLCCIPNLVLYALLQDKIIKGMTLGAVKG